MFKKSPLQKALKNAKKKRINELSNDLDNIAFLDYDGVLNLDRFNYNQIFKNKEPINNLNKFCLENSFKIVIISSWRKYPNYKEILYDSGLNKKIEIEGKTEILGKDREFEIINYLETHPYINKFIILDDGEYKELSKYQIKTEFEKGFDKSKYEEALKMINNQ